ncbi:DUF6069 family protein [Streptomyces sp. 8N706]|uniref:DUF6069 family protein n=1 Tax=Streptomyces sp. 8N706 TaxID=3457416 RepID=UPI003FD1D9B9
MESNAPTALPRPWPSGLLFGVIATMANLIVFAIARAASGEALTVPGWNGNPPQTVGPVPIIIMTLVPAVLAILSGMLLARFTGAPRTIFIAVVGVLTLLSTGGPLSSGAESGTVVALVVMHLLTGAAIGFGVARALPARRAAAPATTA